MFYEAVHTAQNLLDLHSGDNVVLTGGQINGKSGNTNIIKIEVIK